MSGAAVGTVNGARTTYDIYGSRNNQENPSHRKVSNSAVRPPSANTTRLPLSNLPAGRVDGSDYGQVSQQRQHSRGEDLGSHKGKSKIGSMMESQNHLDTRNGSNGNLSTTGSDDIPENMYRPDKEDIEGWIHREKLAKIENEELQAAGINLAKARTKSREQLGDRVRNASRDRLRNDPVTNDGNPREEKLRKVSSPVPIQRYEDEDAMERTDWDLRTPEEIAAERAGSQTYITPVGRRTGSKIPVLSPGMTSTSLDRTTPEPRKRTMSGSISNEEGLHSPKLRAGSSRWNDTEVTPPANSSKTSSPTKMRTKSISAVTGTSISKATGSRTASSSRPNAASPTGRPKTRGSDAERPRTAVNPPEGDPPWLADMYKHDPRLPPDQQLIPTLAKKQRQMQWAEDGMIPKTYNRDFEALAVHEQKDQHNSRQGESEDVPQTEDTEQWPLKPVVNVESARAAPPKPNVVSPPTATGGYSTMPKVSSPPASMISPKIGPPVTANIGAPSPNIGQSRQTSTAQQTSQRTQQRPQLDIDDEKIQKKGCGCCVVM